MSSLRHIRRKSCTGKIRHVSADAARSALGSLFRRRGYQGRMNVYRCRFCNGFHIGHAPRK